MGVVFRSICQSNQVPNKLELISGRIAVALLSETKNKLSLPFAAFAEMGKNQCNLRGKRHILAVLYLFVKGLN